MISEGSCDTGVMDAENSALPSQEYITFPTIIKYKILVLNCKKWFTIFLFYSIYDQINAALVSVITKKTTKKHLKSYTHHTFEW